MSDLDNWKVMLFLQASYPLKDEKDHNMFYRRKSDTDYDKNWAFQSQWNLKLKTSISKIG